VNAGGLLPRLLLIPVSMILGPLLAQRVQVPRGGLATAQLERAPTFADRLGPFELQRTTRDDVRRKLGPAPDVRSTGGVALCYLDETGGLFVELRFGASGGSETLTGYRLTASPPGISTTGDCGRSSGLTERLDAGGVRIGDGAGKLSAALRLPGPLANGPRSFLYSERVPLTEARRKAFAREGTIPPGADAWDLVYRIDVVVIDGRVSELEVARSESL